MVCSDQTILRLHFDEGIPFSGICANQRLVNEDWLTLGNLKLDIQHAVTLPVEGVSQVWNGVATDNEEERRNHTLKSLKSCFRKFNLITSYSMSKGR